MNSKIIYPLLAMVLFLGCATTPPSMQSIPTSPYSYNPIAKGGVIGGEQGVVFDPYEIDQVALPEMRDLPMPASLSTKGPARLYTGVIKNKTGYDVSVPSSNSSGTLIIPARGFIEYIAYKRNFDLTVYHNGKPFYCLTIKVHPKEYAYMCQKYDFLAEIVKPEPAQKKPVKKKRRIKKKPKSEEGSGLG